MKRAKKMVVATLMCALLFPLSPSAQNSLKYQKPPKEILELAMAESAPSVRMDSNKEYMVLSYRNKYKSLDDLRQPEMRLAGIRINPVANIETGVTYVNNLKVRKISDKEEIQVKGLPDNPRIANMSFSPDQKMMAFTHTTANSVELWVMDVAKAEARRVGNKPLNANIGAPYMWMKDNSSLLIRALPMDRMPLIAETESIITGPIISESGGREVQNRTYQDLLKDKTDEDNFDTLVKSELLIMGLDGSVKSFMKSDIYIGISFSPDANYIMITTIGRPYSYVVPMNRFPSKTTVYDISGNLVKVVNETPLTEALPKGLSATTSDRRQMSWRSDKPATLTFAIALDDGDPEKDVEYRDELFQWEAPFDKEPVSMILVPQRLGRVSWSSDKYAFFSDSWGKTRNTKTYVFNPSNPSQKPVVLFDRNSQDIYSDPGSMYMDRNKFDRNIVYVDKDNIYFIGDGYTKEGQFPFIDEFNLKTLKTKRIYQSDYTDKREDIMSIEDIKKGRIMVSIQSKTEYPNYYFRDIKKRGNTALTQVTFFKNPYEAIEGVHKEVIKYKRADGVELSGTLYLPVGYDKTKKEKVPLLIWAYPREYNDPSLAGQSRHNPNTFTSLSYGSFIYWVTQGFAVLDDAAFPIVGADGAEPNDTFIEQLVANAKAAIDAVDEMGYIDRNRVGVGGHSYGAFMTANLLSHCDLFACGIARSGAYNRTLTPFGFQNEQRNYWEAKDVYTSMSPFMNAQTMNHPLLLIHGLADNNSGTFTVQTERYFAALKALGKPARMVLLPLESHGYAAEENVMHTLWEQDTFLKKHLMK